MPPLGEKTVGREACCFVLILDVGGTTGRGAPHLLDSNRRRDKETLIFYLTGLLTDRLSVLFLPFTAKGLFYLNTNRRWILGDKNIVSY